MPEHDVIALDADFHKWQKDRAVGLLDVEPYLYYTLEHITKQYNLTDEEVQYGITFIVALPFPECWIVVMNHHR